MNVQQVEEFEWGFDVPSSQVDLEKIYNDLLMLDAFSKVAYVSEMELKAPRVFARYRDKYLGGLKGWGR